MARTFLLQPDEAAPSRLTLDYAGDLNAQQHAAATTGPGAVLVLAGAGTGKTRTLVYRVAYLVETGTPPEAIVLLTFTRRAAREMLGRASALLDGRCERVEGGTFHAFCAQILRRFAPRLGLPHGFTLLDASDAADVLDLLRTREGFDKSAKRFPKKGTLQSVISAARNKDADVAETLAERYPHFAAHAEAVANLADAYAAYKRDHGLVDYDDLLLLTLHLFDEHPEVKTLVASGIRHVLVDEYQDTNPAQARLVEAFASVHGNVMAVGDDAQSIYRFRGADFANIFGFPERFPGARLLKLEENYRSVQPVLDLANRLLAQATRRYDKTLFTTQKPTGELPAVVAARDDRTEARFVVQMILQQREAGVPLARMAVLFRSAFHSFELELELARRGVPFVKFGGMKLAEAAHIKDVVAHLKLAENPRDAPAWLRVLQLLPGIGARTADGIAAWTTSGSAEPYTLPENAPKLRKHAHRLDALMALLRRLQAPGLSVMQQVEAVLAYYTPILKEKYAEDFPKREQDLEHFVGLADGFRSRAAFVEALALDPIELTALNAEAETHDEPPLVLSTVHSAKGLEFDTVFVLHLLDGYLPSAYALASTDDLDEELRLLYVAVTRAETNLFLSYPVAQYRRFAGDVLTKPSRFLAPLGPDVLEPMQLVETPALPLPPSPPVPKIEAQPTTPRPPRTLKPAAPLPPGDAEANLPF